MVLQSDEVTAILKDATSQIAKATGIRVSLNVISVSSVYAPALRRLLADHFDIDPMDIYGSSRVGDIVKARHLYCWVCHNILGLSMQSIGDDLGKYGNRSSTHSTVSCSIKVVNTFLKTGIAGICDSVDVITREIKNHISKSNKRK